MEDREKAADAAGDAEANPRVRVYGLSVEWFCGMSLDEVLRATKRPHRKVRLTTAQRIRSAGMDVIPTLGGAHGTLRVPKPLDDEAWERVQQVFDPPITNQYAGRRG